MNETIVNRYSVVKIVEADKLGSATSPLGLARTVAVTNTTNTPRAGDVVAVRTLTDSATYNMLELPTGRLAKINPGDVVIGVLAGHIEHGGSRSYRYRKFS